LAGTLGLSAGPAFADSAPCSNTPPLAWQGPAVERAVTIPGAALVTIPGAAVVTIPGAGRSLVGEVFRPADTKTYPGPRPAIIVLHGLGDSQCGVWWAARALAGHGYSTLTFTNPDPGTDDYYANAKAALAFLVGKDNPYAAYTDASRVGASGHSQGSIEAALLQADPKNGVSAIVAFDNIHRWVYGDPGAAEDCSPTVPEMQQITPRVPALGEAEDAPCTTAPFETGADLKETGWAWWRAAGIPTELVDIAGAKHTDWSQSAQGDAHASELHIFAYYAQAWFDRWLLGACDAQARLLARSVLDQPVTKVLSNDYLSGAFLPGAIDTSGLAATLAAVPGATAPASCPRAAGAVRVRWRFRGHGYRLHRVLVELWTTREALNGVTVELLRGRHLAARAHVVRITTARLDLTLRPSRATRFGVGYYTLLVQAAGRTVVRQRVYVA
jgi:hypothetical protein